ncbi:MAG: aminoacyl-tRNA hydrolase [Treponema sp.]|jgi:ribosome-associated protein|nr:aminoacyl-tRNA hydrolase [Treponema sp.]
MDAFLLHQSIRAAAQADFSRSGGPGGQNVNKVNTKVTLRVRLDDLAGLADAELARLKQTLASRVTGEGELVIASSEERSQRVNLERAYARMEAVIACAARLPKRRHPTKPSRAAREERLKTKKRRGLMKAERRAPRDEE